MDTGFSSVNREQVDLLASLAEDTGKLDNSPVGFVMFGLSPTYTILSHNHFYQHLFPEESVPSGFQGRLLAEFLPPDIVDNVLAIFGEVERTGKIANISEFPFDGLPCGRTWWNWLLLPVCAHNGQLIALSVFAVEVTASVLTRQQLEETNRRLIAEFAARAELEEQMRLQNKLLDAVEQAVIATDLMGRIFYWNRFAESLYGWSLEEVIGRNIAEVTPAPEQIAQADQIMESLRSGQSWAGEFLMQHRDGHHFPAYVTDSPIHNESGELIGIVGISSNISERKQAEDEIRRLNENLEKRVADRTRELAVLYDIASLSAQSLDPDEMLQRVMSEVLAAMNCTAVTIQLAEPDQNTFILAGQVGVPTSLTDMLNRGPADAGIPGSVLFAERPVILHDLEKDVWGAEVLRVAGLRTYVGVPMRRSDTTIGVLSVYSDGRYAYRVEDIALLSSIADQLAVIVHNSQLRALTQQRLRQLNLLYQAENTLHSHLNLDDLLQTLPDLAVDIGGASCAWLLRTDQPEQRHILWSQRSLKRAMMETPGFVPGAGLADHVLAAGEAILVEDVQDDARIARPDLLLLAGIRSLGSIPLVVNDAIVGLLNVAFDQRGKVNLETWRFCIALVDRATLAIKNAQIHEQSQRGAVLEERQRLARDLHDSVNQTLFGLASYAESGRQQSIRQSDDEEANRWKVAKEMVQQAMKEMRLLMHELRPATLQKQGIVAALQARLNSVEEHVGIKTYFVAHNLPAVLPDAVEDALFRIAQEALNNVIKHARANAVTVELEATDNEITISVTDSGCGFDPDDVHGVGGMGLSNLEVRAARLGGHLHVWSTPGAGTRIESSIPVSKTAKEADQ